MEVILTIRNLIRGKCLVDKVVHIWHNKLLVTLTRVSPTFRLLYNSFPPGCLLTFLLLTLLRQNFSLLVSTLKQQLSKIDNSSLNTTHSARNLGFIYDEHLTFSDHISSLSKSCYSHIRQLRCIRPYLDSKTASTIAASIVHSKLDYCNSLYYNLPKSQINRLQQIRNCLARTVVKVPKSSLVTTILRSLHWLKINERIEYKLLSLTDKVITTSQPDYLHNLISV